MKRPLPLTTKLKLLAGAIALWAIVAILTTRVTPVVRDQQSDLREVAAGVDPSCTAVPVEVRILPESSTSLRDDVFDIKVQVVSPEVISGMRIDVTNTENVYLDEFVLEVPSPYQIDSDVSYLRYTDTYTPMVAVFMESASRLPKSITFASRLHRTSGESLTKITVDIPQIVGPDPSQPGKTRAYCPVSDVSVTYLLPASTATPIPTSTRIPSPTPLSSSTPTPTRAPTVTQQPSPTYLTPTSIPQTGVPTSSPTPTRSPTPTVGSITGSITPLPTATLSGVQLTPTATLMPGQPTPTRDPRLSITPLPSVTRSLTNSPSLSVSPTRISSITPSIINSQLSITPAVPLKPRPTPTVVAGAWVIDLSAEIPGASRTSGRSVLSRVRTSYEAPVSRIVIVPFDIEPVAEGDWSAAVAVPDPGTGALPRVVKFTPEKHLPQTICVTPVAGMTCSVVQRDSSRILRAGKLTFTPGDLPIPGGVQDGVIDSYDLSFIRSNLGSRRAEAVTLGDVTYDGIVDTQDYLLIMRMLTQTGKNE